MNKFFNYDNLSYDLIEKNKNNKIEVLLKFICNKLNIVYSENPNYNKDLVNIENYYKFILEYIGEDLEKKVILTDSNASNKRKTIKKPYKD